MQEPINVDIKADLTDSANTISQGSVKGLSRLFNLIGGKCEANVQRHRVLTATQTQKDCQDIIDGKVRYIGNELVPIENSTPTPIENPILAIEQHQEMYNLQGNLQVAYDVLKDTPDEEVSDKAVDSDFFARWRREAKVIGQEELQYIWGRILAEEIKEPGTISYRTLDIIKNITTEEAELFTKVASFACDKCILVSFIENPYYSYSDMRKLEECGLVSGVEQMSQVISTKTYSSDSNEYYVLEFNGIIITFSLPEIKLKMNGPMLTTQGKELLKISHIEPLPHDMIGKISNLIKIEGSYKGSITVYPYDKKNNNVLVNTVLYTKEV